jgi:hypothetical protein
MLICNRTMLKNMSSYSPLDSRLTELTRKLNQKDAELNQQLDEIMEAKFDEIDQEKDRDIETGEELRRRVEAVKKGIKDALNSMEEDLSRGDLVAAHIDRWVAHQWLKASK